MFSPRRGLWVSLLCLLALAVFASAPPVFAQTGASATLFSLSTQAFPHLTAYLDVHDASGAFVHGLQTSEVRILEDGRELPISQLEEQNPGVQFVVAITLGPFYAIRDAQGVTRFEYLKQGLLSWDPETAGIDDLSLLTSDGLEIAHTNDPTEILDALQTYQPEAGNAVPDLQVLARALELAADSTPRPSMGRAVLFITPLQGAEITVGLQSLAGRAAQDGIRIYIWLVAAADYFGLPGAEQLSAAATQANGNFFAFSGVEPIPDLEGYLEPLRHVYSIAYDSQVSASGTHQVVAQVSAPVIAGDQALLSPPLNFEISLQAPQPAFNAPPAQIARTQPAVQPTGQPAEAGSELVPAEQALRISVEFPDGYPRPLARTTLYVDGAVMDENTAAPFDTFTWDLRSYVAGGPHVLKVEVVDKLGLSGQSSEITVQVNVPRPSQNLWAAFSRQRGLLTGLIVLVSGAVLVLVLILGGRIRPAQLPGQAQRPLASRRANGSSAADPLTQPVEITAETTTQAGQASRAGWASRLHWPQRHTPATKALAYLTPLLESAVTGLPAPIPLDADELTLGSDPQQANLVLDHPSVEKLHARLRRIDGVFRLSDCGSVAGVWVNYTPVSATGTPLEHGDLLHIGQLGFRFTLREPGPLRKPVVLPLEHEA
jgi:hypothetical protein